MSVHSGVKTVPLRRYSTVPACTSCASPSVNTPLIRPPLGADATVVKPIRLRTFPT